LYATHLIVLKTVIWNTHIC